LIDDRSLAEQTFDHIPIDPNWFGEERTEHETAFSPEPNKPRREPPPGPRVPAPKFSPAVTNRAIKEKHRADRPAAPAEPADPRAERLYAEAKKAASAGDVPAARRHLKLALTYAPGNERFRRALERLGVSVP